MENDGCMVSGSRNYQDGRKGRECAWEKKDGPTSLKLQMRQGRPWPNAIHGLFLYVKRPHKRIFIVEIKWVMPVYFDAENFLQTQGQLD
ncbi:MAG: hypothetical protein IPH12_15000 [Saprospirales bacterium]|jgi:hypothetical protein|nr:hypothetical protein [Saprospirales bacterium]